MDVFNLWINYESNFFLLFHISLWMLLKIKLRVIQNKQAKLMKAVNHSSLRKSLSIHSRILSAYRGLVNVRH